MTADFYDDLQHIHLTLSTSPCRNSMNQTHSTMSRSQIIHNLNVIKFCSQLYKTKINLGILAWLGSTNSHESLSSGQRCRVIDRLLGRRNKFVHSTVILQCNKFNYIKFRFEIRKKHQTICILFAIYKKSSSPLQFRLK